MRWFPLFWLPPLSFVVPREGADHLSVDRWRVGALNSVVTLPGLHTTRAGPTAEIDREPVGPETCDSPTVLSRTFEKDGVTCARSTTCHRPIRIIRREMKCLMEFTSEAGHAYDIRVSDEESLVVTDSDSGQIRSEDKCYWSEPFSEYGTESRATTDTSRNEGCAQSAVTSFSFSFQISN